MVKKIFKIYLLITLIFFPIGFLYAENPLSPLNLSTPRHSISIFMNSMNTYREGMVSNDPIKTNAIFTAIKCLNLKDISPLIREEQGKEIAIYLKETIDRVYVFDKDFIEVPIDRNLSLWSIPETEISIGTEESTGKKEYLFTPSTVLNSRIYFTKTKHLPFLKDSGNGADYYPPLSERLAPKWANTSLFGLFLWQWMGLLLAIFLGLWIKLSSTYFFEILVKIASKTSLIWDDKIFLALSKPGGNIITLGFWYFFLYLAGIDGKIYIVISYILKLFLGIYFIQFLHDFSDIIGNFYKQQIISSEDPSDIQLISVLIKLTKIALVSLGIMLSLQNLGINVISLLAGLGIGGLAIALAARDTAANLFGSLMILLDKPFKTGDHVVIGNIEGLVEEIGFRSTMIRGSGDSVFSLPNSLIANSNIENLGARRKIRKSFSIFFPYDTNPRDLEAFIEKVKLILKSNPFVLPEKLNVSFSKITDPGLEISILFFMVPLESEEELLTIQTIYLNIFKIAADLKIKFINQSSTYSLDMYSTKEDDFLKSEFQ
jgi:MscS family membrane protein